MSDEKVLTKEIAEQFLADEDSVDLSEFTAIEDDASEPVEKTDFLFHIDSRNFLSSEIFWRALHVTVSAN